MIIVSQRTWWRQLTVWRGTDLQRIWPRLLLTTAVTGVATFFHLHGDINLSVLTPLPFTLISVAIGIFLGFRNGASYDRFWEGRKLWGELVNTSRTWARQVAVLVDNHEVEPTERQHEMVRGVIAFVHLLRAHLRDEPTCLEARDILSPPDGEALVAAPHRPLAALHWLGERLRRAIKDRAVDPLHVPLLEGTLMSLTNVMGACERIKNTPLPASYSVLIHRIVAVYVFTLPLGIIETTGAYTPAVVLLIAYAFLGLDAIGEELENPFGLDPNDLPLSSISRNIEIDLRRALGEIDVPPRIVPVSGVLS
jgi:putative membrane protein